MSNLWVSRNDHQSEMTNDELETDRYHREICSVLNKLTPQKFTILLESLLRLDINSEFKMKQLAQFIIKKAINEPIYSEVYARFCSSLCKNLVENGNHQCAEWFKTYLLNDCRKSFECIFSDNHENYKVDCDCEEEWREFIIRHEIFASVIFLGQLYKVNMVSENIISNCILLLLKESNTDTYELQLECFCKLFEIIGKKFENKRQDAVNIYFNQLKDLLENREFCSRVKFALLDIIELRQNNWISRRKSEVPTTIDSIRSPTGG